MRSIRLKLLRRKERRKDQERHDGFRLSIDYELSMTNQLYRLLIRTYSIMYDRVDENE